LFIPLGGSKGKSRWFAWRNLMITMVLGGLWHGASMHFVVWGAYQGIMLIAHKIFKEITDRIPALVNAKQSLFGRAAAVILTFHIVCIGWVFFRADSMSAALSIIQKLLFLDGPLQSLASRMTLTIVNTTDPALFMLLPFLIALLFAGQLIVLLNQKHKINIPRPLQAIYLAALISLLMIFSPDGSPKFIYFQF
jgi:alginate O-acetyltransferase complex protein AlgI